MRADRKVDFRVKHVLSFLLCEELLSNELEIFRVAEATTTDQVNLDEMLEVPKFEPLPDSCLVAGRKCDPAAGRELEQSGRLDRAFEMDMELDLGHSPYQELARLRPATAHSEAPESRSEAR